MTNGKVNNFENNVHKISLEKQMSYFFLFFKFLDLNLFTKLYLHIIVIVQLNFIDLFGMIRMINIMTSTFVFSV